MSAPAATRHIARAVIFAVVFAGACFLLGRWQLSRFEEKDARAAAIEANYHRDPVPLRTVLGSVADTLAEERGWTAVTVDGTYAADRTFLVRGRTFSSAPGMEVLVPLRVEGGGVLLVDRGWVANADDAATLPAVPAPPTGRVSLRGWLRPGEPDRTTGLPAGQLGSVNLAEAARQLGEPVYGAYLVLGAEDPPPSVRPQLLPAPVPDRGPHVAYAIQWFMTALLGFGFVVHLWRSRPEAMAAREARVRDTAAGEAAPRKVRIWDEEDS